MNKNLLSNYQLVKNSNNNNFRQMLRKDLIPMENKRSGQELFVPTNDNNIRIIKNNISLNQFRSSTKNKDDLDTNTNTDDIPNNFRFISSKNSSQGSNHTIAFI